MTLENPRFLLKKRPQSNDAASCLEFARVDIADPGPGEVLLQTLWLSVEPYMMLAMTGSLSGSARRGKTRMQSLMWLYAAGVGIGEVMPGPAVCRVIKSRHPGFADGDIVTSYSGWQCYAIDDGEVLRKIEPGRVPLSAHLGVLGIPGLTGYSGMKAIGQPREGEAVVVSAAIGAVGSVAAQVAQLAGAKTLGITSTEAKRLRMIEELRFDAGADRRAENFADQIREACPRGIDVYFENVGGMVWRTVLPMLRPFARVPVSGTVADYSPDAGEGERDRVPELMKRVVPLRLTIRGFTVFDFPELEDEFSEVISDRVQSGAFRYVEDIYQGLEAAPAAMNDILTGQTNGKVVIKIAE